MQSAFAKIENVPGVITWNRNGLLRWVFQYYKKTSDFGNISPINYENNAYSRNKQGWTMICRVLQNFTQRSNKIWMLVKSWERVAITLMIKVLNKKKTIEKRTLLLGSTSGLANQRLHEPHAGLCPVSLGSYVNTVFIRVKSQNFVAVVHLESRESHEVTSITINGLQISVIIMLVCDIYNKSSWAKVCVSVRKRRVMFMCAHVYDVVLCGNTVRSWLATPDLRHCTNKNGPLNSLLF